VSRQEELAEDLRRLIGFLNPLVAEANHLKLPVPANAVEVIASLNAWHDQLRKADASGSPPSHG
jgi:hypothetical protein